MALYELRTYTLYVGKMAEATKLYQELGFPALKKGDHDKKLVGYFQADTGTINQLVHLWKFDDDADRRKHSQRSLPTRTSWKALPRSSGRLS
jgi:NIPSNAP